MYKYPESLIDYLTDKESDGNEIFITHTEGGAAFIIKESGLENWITYVEWYENSEDFTVSNICGPAFDRLESVMAECRSEAVE